MAPKSKESKAQETGQHEAEKSGAREVGVFAVSNDGVKTLIRTYSADDPSHNEVGRKVDGKYVVSPMPFTAKAEQFVEILRRDAKGAPIQYLVEKIR